MFWSFGQVGQCSLRYLTHGFETLCVSRKRQRSDVAPSCHNVNRFFYSPLNPYYVILMSKAGGPCTYGKERSEESDCAVHSRTSRSRRWGAASGVARGSGGVARTDGLTAVLAPCTTAPGGGPSSSEAQTGCVKAACRGAARGNRTHSPPVSTTPRPAHSPRPPGPCTCIKGQRSGRIVRPHPHHYRHRCIPPLVHQKVGPAPRSTGRTG